jgi:anti-sigma regulatory factor (Ser/Thr protein kinase)
MWLEIGPAGYRLSASTGGRRVTGTERRARIELKPDPPSVADARRFVAVIAHVWECDDLSTVAVLLTSEVVTNAVRYAKRPIQLELQLDAESATLRVETREDHPDPPYLKNPTLESEGGRGLHLVDQLANRWGVERLEGGKTVWFEIRRPGERADRARRRAASGRRAGPLEERDVAGLT